jgi:hypothetical protein
MVCSRASRVSKQQAQPVQDSQRRAALAVDKKQLHLHQRLVFNAREHELVAAESHVRVSPAHHGLEIGCVVTPTGGGDAHLAERAVGQEPAAKVLRLPDRPRSRYSGTAAALGGVREMHEEVRRA